MVAVPSGTVTFLFTDIEGSTRLWETYPHAMSRAHAQHDALTETVITGHDGYLFKRVGDAACATFDRARDALEAALEIQRLLREIAWESGFPGLHVRMALHTGDAELREGDYFGLTLSRVARLLSAGHGGQILLSQVTHQILCDEPPMEVSFDDLGCHRLKDLQRAEGIFQVVHPSLTREFPALRTLDARPNNLPVQLTSFVGREQELAQVAERMATGRLLTLTGAGGTGKTRLALQLAANQVEDYPGGVWFIDLAPVLSPDLVAQTILTTLRLKEDPTRDALDVVMEYLADKAALLLLDNCEHLIDASATVAKKLLQSCNDLRILATSREPLRITGEQVFRIPSLGVPPESAQAEPELAAILPQYEAVRLFMDRALAVQPAFELTSANAPALAQLCIHLDGIPLAIELAAARMRAMTLEQIAARLDNRFRLLTGGDRSALPRQQTLRSLIDWSYDLLSPVEQAMLRRLAVFVGGWTLDAAEQVCAGDPLEEWEILAFLTSLVEKSL